MTKKQIHHLLMNIMRTLGYVDDNDSINTSLLYIQTAVTYLKFENEALKREKIYLENLLKET